MGTDTTVTPKARDAAHTASRSQTVRASLPTVKVKGVWAPSPHLPRGEGMLGDPAPFTRSQREQLDPVQPGSSEVLINRRPHHIASLAEHGVASVGKEESRLPLRDSEAVRSSLYLSPSQRFEQPCGRETHPARGTVATLFHTVLPTSRQPAFTFLFQRPLPDARGQERQVQCLCTQLRRASAVMWAGCCLLHGRPAHRGAGGAHLVRKTPAWRDSPCGCMQDPGTDSWGAVGTLMRSQAPGGVVLSPARWGSSGDMRAAGWLPRGGGGGSRVLHSEEGTENSARGCPWGRGAFSHNTLGAFLTPPVLELQLSPLSPAASRP